MNKIEIADKSNIYYRPIQLLIAVLLLTAAVLIVVSSSKANAYAGYFLAKYDLYTKHPKLYIYGSVIPASMKENYKQFNIVLVFRGCLIGDGRYEREKSYNQEIISEMNLPQR